MIEQSIKLTLFILAVVMHALPIHAHAAIEDRAAQGDITQSGGARRLKGDDTQAIRNALSNKKVKNVILLIGDGMGDSEITAARNYFAGAGGVLKGIDTLPFTGQYTHYSLDKKSHKPDYVTDSAASATAWASGVKTYNGALGIDVFGNRHPTLLERAKIAGKATGNVSTAALQDATPAAQYAHISDRKCYGPQETMEHCATDALEKGGRGSITEQLIEARADVSLGGGSQSFSQVAKAGKWQGQSLHTQTLNRGYQLVSSLKNLHAIVQADQNQPLLGLFSPGNMPVRWLGPKASRYGSVDKPAVTCTENPERNKDIPTLAEMTAKAINLLQTHQNGFFLQVEGASIDKQNHAANPCGQFGEVIDLDEAVQVALEFARSDGTTLVVVTADHAHSSQIIKTGVKAPGLTQALTTRDGATMAISYATAEEGQSQGHTGTQVRIAADGPYGANIMGLTDQTDLFFILRDAMGIQ